MTTSQEIFDYIEGRLRTVLTSPKELEAALGVGEILPEEQREYLEAAIRSSSLSYRNAVLVQLAYALVGGQQDLTTRHPGGRTVTQKLGTLLDELHIPSVNDAFENIAKNTPRLTRGNFPEFDRFLKWGSDGPGREALDAAFLYMAAKLAELARPVKALPELSPARLGFAAVSALIRELLNLRSQGAYEQYAVAALLEALLEQAGLDEYRIVTKPLTASDHSSGAAADVQVLVRNRTVEGIEVSANPYTEKLKKAEKTVRDYDLGRAHVVARVDDDAQAILDSAGLSEDVSVLDLDAVCSVLVAALSKKYREAALRRMYQLLDRYQSDVKNVNRFVDLLESHGLTIPVEMAS